MRFKKKRGTILLENTIFIILNLIFIATLILFLVLKTSDAAVLEELYAKQIALIIDEAKPGMIIHLNMENAIKKAEKELGKGKIEQIVEINDNLVTVRLRDRGGYSYSFFNDVEVSTYPDTTNNQEYIFVISKYEEEQE